MDLKEGKIVIVGCGPGAKEYLLPTGLQFIQEAGVLAGTPHLLETFAPAGKKQIRMGRDTTALLDALTPHVGHEKVVVLVTGDPGLCSLAGQVIERFGRDRCSVIPGISSVQTAFARVALDWRDACIVRAHSGTPTETLDSLASQKKIAVLAGGELSRDWLCSLAGVMDARCVVVVCSNLTLSDERVEFIAPAALRTVPLPSRSVVLFIEKGCLI